MPMTQGFEPQYLSLIIKYLPFGQCLVLHARVLLCTWLAACLHVDDMVVHVQYYHYMRQKQLA